MKKLLYLAALFSFSAHAQNWQLIDDPEALAEINYYIDQPDPFGPEWMIGISIAPVVENPMAGWFK
jgi:hypothetical protein